MYTSYDYIIFTIKYIYYIIRYNNEHYILSVYTFNIEIPRKVEII